MYSRFAENFASKELDPTYQDPTVSKSSSVSSKFNEKFKRLQPTQEPLHDDPSLIAGAKKLYNDTFIDDKKDGFFDFLEIDDDPFTFVKDGKRTDGLGQSFNDMSKKDLSAKWSEIRNDDNAESAITYFRKKDGVNEDGSTKWAFGTEVTKGGLYQTHADEIESGDIQIIDEKRTADADIYQEQILGSQAQMAERIFEETGEQVNGESKHYAGVDILGLIPATDELKMKNEAVKSKASYVDYQERETLYPESNLDDFVNTLKGFGSASVRFTGMVGKGITAPFIEDEANSNTYQWFQSLQDEANEIAGYDDTDATQAMAYGRQAMDNMANMEFGLATQNVLVGMKKGALEGIAQSLPDMIASAPVMTTAIGIGAMVLGAPVTGAIMAGTALWVGLSAIRANDAIDKRIKNGNKEVTTKERAAIFGSEMFLTALESGATKIATGAVKSSIVKGAGGEIVKNEAGKKLTGVLAEISASESVMAPVYSTALASVIAMKPLVKTIGGEIVAMGAEGTEEAISESVRILEAQYDTLKYKDKEASEILYANIEQIKNSFAMGAIVGGGMKRITSTPGDIRAIKQAHTDSKNVGIAETGVNPISNGQSAQSLEESIEAGDKEATSAENDIIENFDNDNTAKESLSKLKHHDNGRLYSILKNKASKNLRDLKKTIFKDRTDFIEPNDKRYMKAFKSYGVKFSDSDTESSTKMKEKLETFMESKEYSDLSAKKQSNIAKYMDNINKNAEWISAVDSEMNNIMNTDDKFRKKYSELKILDNNKKRKELGKILKYQKIAESNDKKIFTAETAHITSNKKTAENVSSFFSKASSMESFDSFNFVSEIDRLADDHIERDDNPRSRVEVKSAIVIAGLAKLAPEQSIKMLENLTSSIDTNENPELGRVLSKASGKALSVVTTHMKNIVNKELKLAVSEDSLYGSSDSTFSSHDLQTNVKTLQKILSSSMFDSEDSQMINDALDNIVKASRVENTGERNKAFKKASNMISVASNVLNGDVNTGNGKKSLSQYKRHIENADTSSSLTKIEKELSGFISSRFGKNTSSDSSKYRYGTDELLYQISYENIAMRKLAKMYIEKRDKLNTDGSLQTNSGLELISKFTKMSNKDLSAKNMQDIKLKEHDTYKNNRDVEQKKNKETNKAKSTERANKIVEEIHDKAYGASKNNKSDELSVGSYTKKVGKNNVLHNVYSHYDNVKNKIVISVIASYKASDGSRKIIPQNTSQSEITAGGSVNGLLDIFRIYGNIKKENGDLYKDVVKIGNSYYSISIDEATGNKRVHEQKKLEDITVNGETTTVADMYNVIVLSDKTSANKNKTMKDLNKFNVISSRKSKNKKEIVVDIYVDTTEETIIEEEPVVEDDEIIEEPTVEYNQNDDDKFNEDDFLIIDEEVSSEIVEATNIVNEIDEAIDNIQDEINLKDDEIKNSATTKIKEELIEDKKNLIEKKKDKIEEKKDTLKDIKNKEDKLDSIVSAQIKHAIAKIDFLKERISAKLKTNLSSLIGANTLFSSNDKNPLTEKSLKDALSKLDESQLNGMTVDEAYGVLTNGGSYGIAKNIFDSIDGKFLVGKKFISEKSIINAFGEKFESTDGKSYIQLNDKFKEAVSISALGILHQIKSHRGQTKEKVLASFGVSDTKDINAKNIDSLVNTARNSGVAVNVMYSDSASALINSMGIKFNEETVTKEELSQFNGEVGTLIKQAVESSGQFVSTVNIEINGNRPILMKPKKNSMLDNVEAKNISEYVYLTSSLFGIAKHTKEPVYMNGKTNKNQNKVITPKKQKNSKENISDERQNKLENMSNNIYSVNSAAKLGHFMDMELLEIASGVENDIGNLPISKRESQIGKNNGIRTNLENFFSRLPAGDRVSKLWGKFKLGRSATKVLRASIDNVIDISGNKVHRHLVSNSGMSRKISVSGKNGKDNKGLVLFKLGLAQSLGLDVDKMTDTSVLNELLDEYVDIKSDSKEMIFKDDKLEDIVNGLQDKELFNLVFGKHNKDDVDLTKKREEVLKSKHQNLFKKIANYSNGKEEVFTLLAVAELAKMKNALDNGDGSFVSDMTVELDGITSGMSIALLGLGINIETNIAMQLTKGGIYSEAGIKDLSNHIRFTNIDESRLAKVKKELNIDDSVTEREVRDLLIESVNDRFKKGTLTHGWLKEYSGLDDFYESVGIIATKELEQISISIDENIKRLASNPNKKWAKKKIESLEEQKKLIEIIGDEISRKKAKTGTMSAVYGQGKISTLINTFNQVVAPRIEELIQEDSSPLVLINGNGGHLNLDVDIKNQLDNNQLHLWKPTNDGKDGEVIIMSSGLVSGKNSDFKSIMISKDRKKMTLKVSSDIVNMLTFNGSVFDVINEDSNNDTVEISINISSDINVIDDKINKKYLHSSFKNEDKYKTAILSNYIYRGMMVKHFIHSAESKEYLKELSDGTYGKAIWDTVQDLYKPIHEYRDSLKAANTMIYANAKNIYDSMVEAKKAEKNGSDLTLKEYSELYSDLREKGVLYSINTPMKGEKLSYEKTEKDTSSGQHIVKTAFKKDGDKVSSSKQVNVNDKRQIPNASAASVSSTLVQDGVTILTSHKNINTIDVFDALLYGLDGDNISDAQQSINMKTFEVTRDYSALNEHMSTLMNQLALYESEPSLKSADAKKAIEDFYNEVVGNKFESAKTYSDFNSQIYSVRKDQSQIEHMVDRLEDTTRNKKDLAESRLVVGHVYAIDSDNLAYKKRGVNEKGSSSSNHKSDTNYGATLLMSEESKNNLESRMDTLKENISKYIKNNLLMRYSEVKINMIGNSIASIKYDYSGSKRKELVNNISAISRANESVQFQTDMFSTSRTISNMFKNIGNEVEDNVDVIMKNIISNSEEVKDGEALVGKEFILPVDDKDKNYDPTDDAVVAIKILKNGGSIVFSSHSANENALIKKIGETKEVGVSKKITRLTPEIKESISKSVNKRINSSDLASSTVNPDEITDVITIRPKHIDKGTHDKKYNEYNNIEKSESKEEDTKEESTETKSVDENIVESSLDSIISIHDNFDFKKSGSTYAKYFKAILGVEMTTQKANSLKDFVFNMANTKSKNKDIFMKIINSDKKNVIKEIIDRNNFSMKEVVDEKVDVVEEKVSMFGETSQSSPFGTMGSSDGSSSSEHIETRKISKSDVASLKDELMDDDIEVDEHFVDDYNSELNSLLDDTINAVFDITDTVEFQKFETEAGTFGQADTHNFKVRLAGSKKFVGQSRKSIFSHEMFHLATQAALSFDKGFMLRLNRIKKAVLSDIESKIEEPEFMFAKDDSAEQKEMSKKIFNYVFFESKSNEFFTYALTDPTLYNYIRENEADFKVDNRLLKEVGMPNGKIKGILVALYNKVISLINKAYKSKKDKNTVGRELLDMKIETQILTNSLVLKKYNNGAYGKWMKLFNGLLSDKIVALRNSLLSVYEKSFDKGIDVVLAEKYSTMKDSKGAVLVKFAIDMIHAIVHDVSTDQRYFAFYKLFDKIKKTQEDDKEHMKSSVIKHFNKKLGIFSLKERTKLLKLLVDTDISTYSKDIKEIQEVVNSPLILNSKIKELRDSIKSKAKTKEEELFIEMALLQGKGLAQYMVHSKTGVKRQMLNADNIANGLFLNSSEKTDASIVPNIKDDLDRLISLQALKISVKDNMVDIHKAPDGVADILDYFKNITEQNNNDLFNGDEKAHIVKGYTKQVQDKNIEMEVIRLEDLDSYLASGWKNTGYDVPVHTFDDLDVDRLIVTRESFEAGYSKGAFEIAGYKSKGTSLRDFHKNTSGIGKDFIDDMISDITNESFDLSADPFSGSEPIPVINVSGKDGASISNYRYTASTSMKDTMLYENNDIVEKIAETTTSAYSKINGEKINKVLIEYAINDYSEAVDKKSYIEIGPKTKFKKEWDILPEYTKQYMKDNNIKTIHIRPELMNDMFGYKDNSIADVRKDLDKTNPKLHRGLTILDKYVKDMVKLYKPIVAIVNTAVMVGNIMSNYLSLVFRGIDPVTAAKDLVKGFRYLGQLRDSAEDSRVLDIRKSTGENVDREIAENKSLLEDNPMFDLWTAGKVSSVVEDVNRDTLTSKNKITDFVNKVLMGDKIRANKMIREVTDNLYVASNTTLFEVLLTVQQAGDAAARYSLDKHNRANGMSKSESHMVVGQAFVMYNTVKNQFWGTLEKLGGVFFTQFFFKNMRVISNMFIANPSNIILYKSIVDTSGIDQFDTYDNGFVGGLMNRMVNPVDIVTTVATPHIDAVI